jgi:type I site-specific restriction-modification system R (restriction) subunit
MGNTENYKNIEEEYIFGIESVDKYGKMEIRFPSRRELAQKHGVPLGTLDGVANRNNWTERRNKYREIAKEARLKKEIESKWTLRAYADQLAIGEIERIREVTDRYFEQFEKNKNKEVTIEELDKLINIIEKRNQLLKTIIEKVEDDNTDREMTLEAYKRIRYEEEKKLMEIKEKEKEEKELLRKKRDLERRIKEKMNRARKYKWN